MSYTHGKYLLQKTRNREKVRSAYNNEYTSEVFSHSEVESQKTSCLRSIFPEENSNSELILKTQAVNYSHSLSSIDHYMSRREKIRFVILRSIGNFLVLFSLYGVGATFGPALVYEVKYQIIKMRDIKYTVEVNTSSAVQRTSPGFGEALIGAKQQVLVPPDTQFSIVIPKIGATSKVYPNVDPTNEEEFLPLLQTGVAHAKGTVFPGFEGNTYIFAHSTDNFWNVGRYNAVFYLLKELQKGDEIVIFFEGRRYNYVVDRIEIKDAEDVELLVNSQRTDIQQLILQTCWPPGTSWKRLFVIATPQRR
jgi:sortase A